MGGFARKCIRCGRTLCLAALRYRTQGDAALTCRAIREMPNRGACFVSCQATLRDSHLCSGGAPQESFLRDSWRAPDG